MKVNLENYKAALLSNKEDTGAVIVVLGELQEQVEKLEKRLDLVEQKRYNGYIFNTISGSVLGITLMVVGGVEIGLGNDRGLDIVKLGGITFGSIELVYQCGYWLFKWW